MTWLFQTWLRLWNYDPNHLAAFGVLGIIAGQATLALPDGRIKTSLLKFFHGAFPSIQMMANGFVGKGSTAVASEMATVILQRMEEAESKAMQAGVVQPDLSLPAQIEVAQIATVVKTDEPKVK